MTAAQASRGCRGRIDTASCRRCVLVSILVAAAVSWPRPSQAGPEASPAAPPQKVGRIQVIVNVPCPDIAIDADPYRPVDGSATVAAGRHVLFLRCPGYQAFLGEVEVREGELSSYVVKLKPAPSRAYDDHVPAKPIPSIFHLQLEGKAGAALSLIPADSAYGPAGGFGIRFMWDMPRGRGQYGFKFQMHIADVSFGVEDGEEADLRNRRMTAVFISLPFQISVPLGGRVRWEFSFGPGWMTFVPGPLPPLFAGVGLAIDVHRSPEWAVLANIGIDFYLPLPPVALPQAGFTVNF